MTADLYASVLMIAAFAVFSAMSVFMRMISGHIAVPQVILIRQVMALILMAPQYWAARQVIMHPTGLSLHLTRGVLAVGSMFCGLTSIIHIPLADATAISMAEVLIATAFAATLLREPIGWRRWLARVRLVPIGWPMAAMWPCAVGGWTLRARARPGALDRVLCHALVRRAHAQVGARGAAVCVPLGLRHRLLRRRAPRVHGGERRRVARRRVGQTQLRPRRSSSAGRARRDHPRG